MWTVCLPNSYLLLSAKRWTYWKPLLVVNFNWESLTLAKEENWHLLSSACKRCRKFSGVFKIITVIAYQVKTIKSTLYQHHPTNFLRTWFHLLCHPWIYFFGHNDALFFFHRDIGNSSYANVFGEIRCITGNVSACGNFIVNSLNTIKKLLSQLHKCRLLYAVFHNSLDEKECSFADNWKITICSHFQ